MGIRANSLRVSFNSSYVEYFWCNIWYVYIYSEWRRAHAILEIRQMEPMVIDLEAPILEEIGTEPFAISGMALEGFESRWFRQILTLIFIMAIIQIAHFLWAVRLDMTSSVKYTMLLFYEFLLKIAIYTAVFVFFAAICLYLRFHGLPLLSILLMRYPRVDGKRRLVIQNCLWMIWIGSITVGLVEVDLLL